MRRLGVGAALAIGLAGLAIWYWLRGIQQFDDVGDEDVIYPAGVRHIADGIAFAEGFGTAGAIPTRAHNPGDLVIPGWTGETLGNQGITVFPTVEEGWRRLYKQVNLIATGTSRVYTRGADETIRSIAARWTTTEQDAWTRNVVQRLRDRWGYYDVTADTRIGDLV